MEREWYLMISNKRYGPYTLDDMKGYVTQGRIQATHLVWKKGYKEWLPASKSPELGSMLAAPAPVAEPPKAKSAADTDVQPVVEDQEEDAPATAQPEAEEKVAEPVEQARTQAESELDQAVATVSASEQATETPEPKAEAPAEPAPPEEPQPEPEKPKRGLRTASRLQAAKPAPAPAPAVATPLELPALLTSETIVKEVSVQHATFGIGGGQTRAALTNQRVLVAATRTFGPLFWVLVAVCPFVIIAYFRRIRKEKHASIQLKAIDSVEKGYRSSGAILCIWAFGCAGLYMLLPFLFTPYVLALFMEWLFAALVSAGLFFVMVQTRVPVVAIVSGNNRIVVEFAQGDPERDAFFDAIAENIAK